MHTTTNEYRKSFQTRSFFLSLLTFIGIPLSLSLSLCLSVSPSLCLSLCPSPCLSLCPSLRLSLCPSLWLSLSLCLSLSLSLCLSLSLSLSLCLSLSVSLSLSISVFSLSLFLSHVARQAHFEYGTRCAALSRAVRDSSSTPVFYPTTAVSLLHQKLRAVV